MKVFNEFRGSKAWASRILNVSKPTITRYLNGLITSQMLDEEIPRIAALLVASHGECIDGANGKSVRSRIRRLRADRKRGKK